LGVGWVFKGPVQKNHWNEGGRFLGEKALKKKLRPNARGHENRHLAPSRSKGEKLVHEGSPGIRPPA